MDVTTLAALAGAGALLVTLLTVSLVASRRGKRLRRAALAARHEAGEHATAADTANRRTSIAAAGEREAAWAARASAARGSALTDRISDLEARLRAAEASTAASEQRVDDLRDEVRRWRDDVARSRGEAEAAASRAAGLETDLGAAGRELSRLRAEIDETRLRLDERPEPAPTDTTLVGRLHAALAEADRLRDRIGALEVTLAATRPTAASEPSAERPRLAADPWEQPRALADRDAAIARLTADLALAHRARETSRVEIERLAAEIARVRVEADRRVAATISELSAAAPVAPTSPAEPSPLLIVREAEIRELEQRLATLTAARNSELRRLNERIASLERLYLDVELRDTRITELESELKQATEMLDALRSDAAALETRLGEAERELASARRALEALAGAEAELHESRRRVVELEAAALHSRTSDGEVDQLRTMLAAERERSVRLVRRASVEGRGEVERAVAAVTRPLRETIARLEAELEARAAAPPPVEPVDVTLIRGIGPRIAGILAANGITSLRRIAAFSPDDVARIGPLLPVYPGRIADDRWIEQARELLGDAG